MHYKPHNYQAQATEFILDHHEAAILLGMGLGKSVITLTAIWELLLDYFTVSRVLVVAPLRVARDTWPAEVAKWDHLAGLSVAVAVGTKTDRLAALAESAMVTPSSTGKTSPGSSASTAIAGRSTWSSSTNSPASRTTVRNGSRHW